MKAVPERKVQAGNVTVAVFPVMFFVVAPQPEMGRPKGKMLTVIDSKSADEETLAIETLKEAPRGTVPRGTVKNA
jgi:hypothetical protein